MSTPIELLDIEYARIESRWSGVRAGVDAPTVESVNNILHKWSSWYLAHRGTIVDEEQLQYWSDNLAIIENIVVRNESRQLAGSKKKIPTGILILGITITLGALLL